jgi:hypothetical protein
MFARVRNRNLSATCDKRNHIDEQVYASLNNLLSEISKMLISLIHKLESNKKLN